MVVGQSDLTPVDSCAAADLGELGPLPTFQDRRGYPAVLPPYRRPQRPSRSHMSRALVIRYIEENLYDPELTPTRAALACSMTPRYLHLLFAVRGETVARYILRRRLEECARALREPIRPERTITAIAFDHGFNSATHFGRAFRARYGLTPRRYRERHEARIQHAEPRPSVGSRRPSP